MYGLEKRRLGDILLEAGALTEEQLKKALEIQRTNGARLGGVLVEQKILREEDILRALSVQAEIPFLSLGDVVIDPEVATLVPEKLARRHNLIPIERREGRIVLAVADPFNVQGIDEVRVLLGEEVDLVLAKTEEIQAAIDEHLAAKQSLQTMLAGMEVDDLEVVQDEADLTEREETEDNQIIKYVNKIILEAVKNRASDVHLEPFENEFQIRQRLDGVLYKMPAPPKAVQNAVTSRVKVMANMNISESRLPQDGRIRLRLAGKELDLRVSTLPTVFGESVVLRILDRSATILTLEQLGMSDAVRGKMERIIQNPNGIVIVTGPTGSGKTSTLYACVLKINSPTDKFITVEDPVEYEVEGLIQVQVNEKVGMTFASALRSILRQDPDKVVIGEIRDIETAEIAIQASLTGHLVLTSLHTNQAAGALTRLIDMGLEPFLISSTILGICGQRLVRRICPLCKTEDTPSPELLKQIAPKGEDPSRYTFYKGAGCPDCAGTGFQGRIGLFELLVVTPEIEELILEKAPANVLHGKARELGMQTMLEDGWEKAKNGITSLEEVLRVAPLDFAS